MECTPLCIGGVADHVHLLTMFPRTITIADFVKETKRVSSIWVHEGEAGSDSFHWQSGYGVFSVSQSQVDTVRRYIECQEEHHRRVSFQEEYREFLKRHNVAFDERYVWD